MHYFARPLLSLFTCAIGGWLAAGSPNLAFAETAPLPPAPPAVEIRLRGTASDADPKFRAWADQLRGISEKNRHDLDTRLTPTAAIEARFAEPMIRPDQVGTEAKEPPLVITPKWAGSFQWTSQSGGVFTPTESAPLGASYRVEVRPGLVKADGQPLQAEAHEDFYAPALEMTQSELRNRSSFDDDTDAIQARLVFNGAVDAKQVEPFLWFRDDEGQRVKASARPLTEKDRAAPRRFTGAQNVYTWSEQCIAARLPSGAEAPKPSFANQLVVSPAETLPVGRNWQLVVKDGLPALDNKDKGARLAKAVNVTVGDCKPFEVAKVRTDNENKDARRIVVAFTRPIDGKVTPENIEHWLLISPKPADCKVSVGHQTDPRAGSEVEISGDFTLDQTYSVAVAKGLPAIGSVALEKSFAGTVDFEIKPPQLTFPDFSAHQLSAGRREFIMQARNAPDIHLRAKLIRPEDAPRALEAYQKEYLSSNDGEMQRADFEKMPGKTIYNGKIDGSNVIDEAKEITLKWDDILGKQRHNGIVLLEAEQPLPTKGQEKRAGVQSIVQLTNLGAVWKVARTGELLAYVFSLNDARPIGGTMVKLLDEAGRVVATAQTGADGLARLDKRIDKVAWLSVTRDDDAHVLRFRESDRDTLSMYRFHLPDSAFRQQDDSDADGDGSVVAAKPLPPDVLMFSERGVYKPGETAHIKAIVRDWRNQKLTMPKAEMAATLKAIDPRGRRFWQKSVTLSESGALSESVELPKATLGRYRVEISFGEPAAAGEEGAVAADAADNADDEDADAVTPNICRFLVQEYQPNAFEVKVAKPAIPPVGAGTVELPLSARYYMGKTLSKARVAWSLTAEDSAYEPDGFGDYAFCLNGNVDYRLREDRAETSLDGQGALSAKGEMLIAPEIALNAAAPGPQTVRLQASVTDQDQQTVTAKSKLTVHSSEFYLGVRTMPDVVRAGEALPLEVVAVNAADGQPRAEPMRVTAKLSLIQWRTNEEENGSGGTDYHGKAFLKAVGSLELDTTRLQKYGKEWEPVEAGQPSAGQLIPTDGGEYLLEVSARDSAGRLAQTTTSFSVLGANEAEWSFRNQWQAQLVPDRAQYAPGDTATVLVKTPISGRALVTVEREGVTRAFTVDIDKARPAVQVPILPGDAPNVYVSVMQMRGLEQSPRKIKEPEYRAGYCQLVVTKADAKLAVDVRPDKAEYQPGEEVSVQVAVTDQKHRPMRGAEVTLYAVDKGVLSLTGYKLPDPLRAFYRPRPLDVRTGLTLPDLLSEDPAYYLSDDGSSMSNKGYLVGGGGGEGMAERMRKNFLACAYWNATLRTDDQGRVAVHFTAPDNLSQYQIMAVVQGAAGKDSDGAGRFGNGQSEFRINKMLMLEPSMPRFGNVGDRLKLRAVLHNQSPTAGDVEVTLELDDKAVAFGADGQPNTEARARRVRLEAGESKSVDFPVEFRKTGQANWTWRARLAGDGPGAPAWRDAVQTTLKVDHPTPRRAEVVSLRLDAERADNILSRVNPEVLEGEDGIVSVSLSNTRINDLTEGMRALLHYPYGCVEQTTSSMLPWLALRDFGDALPDLNRPKREVDAAVERGINRLLSMQTDSGGLAYWPEDSGKEAHPWGSAYGGMGMALARKAGFFVPETEFNKLCEFLSKQLRSGAAATKDRYHEHSETDRCLALYALALAGKGEASYCEQLYNDREKLCPEDRTLLALAIAEGDGSKDMVKALLQPGPREGEKPDAWNEFASHATLTGMRLLAWCQSQPDDAQVETLLSAMLDERSPDGSWSTTQGNAWTLLGMGAYVRNTDKNIETISGTLTMGGKSQPFTIDSQRRTFACELSFGADAEAGAGGAKPVLTLTNPAKRPIYLQAKVESRPRGGGLLHTKPTVGNGEYRIDRQYARVNDDGTLAPAEGLKVGDRVLVNLDVSVPEDASYVAVNDPLPAVLEAINPDFKTQDAGNAPMRRGYSWWSSDFHELREDRALFFSDHPYRGRLHMQYLARVRAAGTATAPAAKIEEMYHPDRYAETAAASMTTGPLE